MAQQRRAEAAAASEEAEKAPGGAEKAPEGEREEAEAKDESPEVKPKKARKRRGKKKDTGGEVTDAVGTIGLFSNISSVKGGYWICFKATIAAIWNLPYCLKRRQVCKHEDFELPLR